MVLADLSLGVSKAPQLFAKWRFAMQAADGRPAERRLKNFNNMTNVTKIKSDRTVFEGGGQPPAG